MQLKRLALQKDIRFLGEQNPKSHWFFWGCVSFYSLKAYQPSKYFI